MKQTRTYDRTSGVLLPVSGLPGPFGIGDLGPTAFRWIDRLAEARQVWWQVLPVGPTGYGDSPYQSPSTFAGNLNLVSPEALENDGLASRSELAEVELPNGAIDYTAVIQNKRRLISTAFQRFQRGEAKTLEGPFRQFIEQEKDWLHDFAVFTAIKERFEEQPWWKWPRPLALRESAALVRIANELDEQIQTQRFGQFLFFRQWDQLKAHAASRGVRLFGDLPIYVAEDSSDVWRHPELFVLDELRRPRLVAGVPPDYFSATGQLWGNPIYAWDEHERTGFQWWVNRIRKTLRLFDQSRLDHFRGIEGFWAVPAGDKTAEHGEWLPGPRERLLGTLAREIGPLPIVAEDLGVITPAVDRLRERFGFSGMRILQFAFGGAVEDRFLPHAFTCDLLVATGTHDNDTTLGWFKGLDRNELRNYAAYVPGAEQDPVWALVRTGWASVAGQAIAPFQDLLELPSSARMNTPGTASGNWRWRASERELNAKTWVERLAEYTMNYRRAANPDKK